MALQTSGTITLAQVQAALGGANPISLSEYYRGGPYVYTLNTSVPSSGIIALSNLYGAKKVYYYTNNSNRANVTISGDFATSGENAFFVWTNNATITSTSTGSYALSTGSFGAGSVLVIINNGTIQGLAGNGGALYTTGGAGGKALYVGTNTIIENHNLIAGGGAGGGGSGYSCPARTGDGGIGGDAIYLATSATLTHATGSKVWGGGGGGGGEGNGGGASSYYRAGSNGSNYNGGYGGYDTYDSLYNPGAGGGPGVNGGNATGRTAYCDPGLGGAAGYAVRKNGNTLTINGSGDTRGSVA